MVTNTTTEYWDVDGVSLNELTQNLSSWGDTREAAAPLRGSNKVVPYMAGERWVAKTPDAKDVILSGWMVGDTEALLRTKWRAFRALLWRPDEQFLLTRRWHDANGVLQTATALAEYKSGMEPSIAEGGTLAKFSVTLRLAVPFFFSAEISLPLVVGDNAFALQGDYPSSKVKVVFTGTQTAASVAAVISGVVDNTVTYTSVGSTATATIDVESFKATELIAGSTTKTSTKVGHSGRAQWLWLPKKTTHIRFARTSGTGTATLKYSPAWH